MVIPKPIKKWLAVVRGEVSPILILLSVMFGFWFGVTPGFYGLHVALLVVALILNTHFGLFLLAGALGKSLSLAGAPVLYHVGVFTQSTLGPLLALLAAVPIVGITDFARYAVAGAVVVGPLGGFLLGAALAKSVLSYRKAWLKLEENSEIFERWREKKWVRLLDRALVGKGARDVREILARRPKLIRWAGVTAAVVVLAAAVVGVKFFLTDEMLTARAAETLTRLNGAQVDIERLSLKPFSGKVAANGIQVTDPEKPQNNRVSIDEFQAQASLYNLLLGRVVLDNLEISALKFDEARAQPGEVWADAEQEEESSEPFNWGQFKLPDVDAHQLATYFKNGMKIKATLAKIEPYLPDPKKKTLATIEPSSPAPKADEVSEPTKVPQRYLEYLSARAPTAPSPRFVARRVVLDHVELPFDKLADSKIECANLSDAPSAAAMPVTVKITSNSSADWMQIISHYEAPEQGAQITAEFNDIDLAELQQNLSSKNPVVFKGGTASAKIDGQASRDMIDLGIKVDTKNMAVESAGGGALGLDPQITGEALKVLQEIDTTLRLVGPVTAPKLVFDVPALREEFHAALLKAGKDQLAGRLGDLIGDKLPIGGEIPTDLDPAKIGDTIGDAVGDLLGKDKSADKDDPDKKEEEKQDDKKDAKDILKGIGDLLGGDKSKDQDDDGN